MLTLKISSLFTLLTLLFSMPLATSCHPAQSQSSKQGATSSAAAPELVNRQWQATLLAAIDSFPEKGGYYTGRRPNETFSTTTWQGLNNAFVLMESMSKPAFNPQAAQPSFCSSATYAVLVKALIMWDKENKISRQAWVNMKPYVGIKDAINTEGFGQDDGVGFWGRCNANGPSLAVLVAELDAGISFHAYRGAMTERNRERADETYLSDEEWRGLPFWRKLIPGDIVKIFWNNNETKGRDSGAIVGYNGVKGEDQEAGHSVIFMGYDAEGNFTYWSSNGPGEVPKEMGYGIGRCDKTRIQRIVVTRILRPERFDRVRDMAPTDVNQYLYDLNGKRHSTTDEILKMINAQ